MIPSIRRLRRAPRRTVTLIVLSFAVYLTAGVCAGLATQPAVGYAGRSDGALRLLAATFDHSTTYVIVSQPLAWATRICWAAAILLLVLAVVVHVRFVSRLSKASRNARASSRF